MSEPTTAQTEATAGGTADLDYGGHTYTVPATTDEWAIDTMEAFEDGKAVAAARAILGRKQFAEFKQRHNTLKQFNEFCDLLSVQYGFKSAGE